MKSAARQKREKREPRQGMPRIQLFGMVLLALVAIFAFANKVGAQGSAPAKPAAVKPAPKVDPKHAAEKLDPKAAEAKAAEAKAAEAKAAEPAHEHEEKKGEAGGQKEPETAEQLKTAVLEDPEKGGVPIHKEGPFRSAFASPGQPLVTAKVGVLLENVEEYDIKKGSFTAHFYLSIASDKPMPEISLNPTNGKIDSKEVLADLPTFKFYKMAGTFNNKPDLHAYPFDTQELVIELEDDSTGQDRLRLLTDVEHTSLDAGFSVPGWDISFIRARILTHYYPDRFDNDDLYYSRYKFSLGIKRFATSAVFTVFVPALVIVLISLSGLWFPRDELEVRCNATTPMLAAAVLFHFALMQELPATAYLSRADKLMMGVYACLGIHMLSSWIWFVFDEKYTETLFRWSKYILCPITFAIMAVGIFL
ncbi:MAG: hypothetical protein KF819_22425 [Labilithrix sp.]|nr:hypothetical protein [Labilithrix sp.]